MIFSKVKRLHTANELLLQDYRGFYVNALTGLGVNSLYKTVVESICWTWTKTSFSPLSYSKRVLFFSPSTMRERSFSILT
jgi:hypothetical protein